MQSTAAARRPPGAWLYWLAAVFWLLVPLGMTALAIPQVVQLVQALQDQGMRIQAPGSTVMHFQDPGEFALYVSGQEDEVGIHHRGQGLVLERGLSLQLEDGSGGYLPLQVSAGQVTVSFGATTWVRVAVFTIAQPGSYTLVSRYENGDPTLPTSLLVAARDWPFAQVLEGLVVLLPMLLSALLCILLGVGLAMYVYVRRYDARNAYVCTR